MTWAEFYLVCFAVGFALSLVSFLAGSSHWHPHLPHLPSGHGPMAGGHTGPITAGAGGTAPMAGHAHAAGGLTKGAVQGTAISPFNFATLTAFLAWFGGAGYLLTRYSSVWTLAAMGLAVLAGLIGATIVFLFLAKVLTSPEEAMDPADYEMVGVLGRTSLPIRAAGTGEIIYSQAGTRRTCGARSEDGAVIGKGVEVVVTRYEKGIAYVRKWEDLSGEEEHS
jgi:membrane protein implicated in regulation of membrane protease activity